MKVKIRRKLPMAQDADTLVDGAIPMSPSETKIPMSPER